MRHNPVRGIFLMSSPPQYYCVDDDGLRNPCWSHPCDWWGWAPQSEREVQRLSDEQPALHGLIDDLPDSWTSELRALWMEAVMRVVDSKVPVTEPAGFDAAKGER